MGNVVGFILGLRRSILTDTVLERAVGASLGLIMTAVLAAPAMGHAPGSEDSAEIDYSDAFGGAFSLFDHEGKAVMDESFRGKVMVVYFGYTNCPDICPLDARNIGAAMDFLGAENQGVQPLFITIDPGRDTPARLAEWLPAIHPSYVGITGSDAQIAAVSDAYKVVFERIETADGYDYAMTHPGLIYVMGADGHFLFLLPPGTDPDTIASELRTVLPTAN